MSHIVTVTFPDIGEGVVEGEVIEWLKQPGDQVEQDEPVVVVMTDKATVELPAPAAGKLKKQYYHPGEKAIKDQPLYEIETSASTEEKKAPEKAKPTQISTPSRGTSSANGLQATPPARKLAQELGIDIALVAGTGPEGRVGSEDVARHLSGNKEKREAIPLIKLPDDEELPLMGIRKLMAIRMAESKRKIPHFSYFEQVDATRLVQLKEVFKQEATKQGVVVTFMPFIIKALSMTMNEYPLINSCLDEESHKIIVHKQHNIGIAFSSKQGLTVPVLKNVDKMTLQEIIRAYEKLKEAAHNLKLSPQDMKDGTITISNFGVLGGGGMWATPIINYPEVAILALARIQKQPLVRNSEIMVRDVLNLSWSFDHRIIDGDQAASVSHYFSALLQNPAALL
jgi:pyruvate dehydrogenase E2 component (dihydrolipoamide acetyltransferase)